MSSGISKRKGEAVKTFSELIEADFSPEAVMMAVMTGKKTLVAADGRIVKITTKMTAAAEKLIAFRLPRLNSVDVQQTNVNLTHEQWITQMDGGGGDD